MSFCRSLDGARSVSSSRQNTEKHGGQKKKVRPQRSHTGRRWAQHTEKVQSTRMITWKEDQKIKLQKFICECIYNWLFFLKTFFSFFSLFNFFFQPIQLCYIEAKHSCYVCSVSVQHAGSSPPPSPPPPSLPPIGARPPLWPRLLWLQEHRDVAHSPTKLAHKLDFPFRNETAKQNTKTSRLLVAWTPVTRSRAAANNLPFLRWPPGVATKTIYIVQTDTVWQTVCYWMCCSFVS